MRLYPIIAILLAGCSATVQGSTLTTTPIEAPPTTEPASSSARRTPTRVFIPTLTNTPRPTRTPTPTRLPGGDFNISENDFLFTEAPQCSLPCWHDLRIGDSNLAEFERTAKTTFGFSDANLEDPQFIYSGHNVPENGFQVMGYGKDFDTQGSDLEVNAVADSETQLLRALIFMLSGRTPYSFHTPQTILRLLGEPAAIYAQFIEAPQTAPITGLGRIFILYEEGIAFFTVHEVLFSSDMQFCLDQPIRQELTFIVEPFTQGLSSPNRLQEALLWAGLGTRDYVPAHRAFGLSIADITLRAQTEENACLDVK